MSLKNSLEDTLSAEDIKARVAGMRTRQSPEVLAAARPDRYVLKIIGVFVTASVLCWLAAVATRPKGFPYDIMFLNRNVNNLLFSAEPAKFWDHFLVDSFLTFGLRGLLVCILGLAAPILALLWVRMRALSHASLYIACWGMIIGVPFFLIGLKDFVFPLLSDVFDVLV